MYQYRSDPLYPVAELTPEVIEQAMIRGRKLRAQAYRDLLVHVFGWFSEYRRPQIDIKSLRNGVTVKPGRVV